MNFPTNPSTKSEIIDKYWVDFLRYLKDDAQVSLDEYSTQLVTVRKFWIWYIINIMEPKK